MLRTMGGDRLEQAKRHIGDKLEPILQRLRMGESKTRVGKAFGINQRWLSDLNPLIFPDKEEGKSVDLPEGVTEDPGPTSYRDDRHTMATVRRMSAESMSIKDRIAKLTRLAKSKNEAVSLRALERLDALSGIVPTKEAAEPDPPPLFALPPHSMVALERYEEWSRRTQADQATDTDEPSNV